MKAALCAFALASLAVTTARALPRFDGDDIYEEDYLQDLAGRFKKSPAVNPASASGGRSANDDRGDTVSGGKTTAKDDPKEPKLLKGLRSSLQKPATTFLPGKSDDGSGDAKETDKASGDEADSSRSARQNFPAAYYGPAPTEYHDPTARTFGAAGVVREPQSETVQVGTGGGVGHPQGAPYHQHQPSPLKQLKQLVPNIISAITAILPPPTPGSAPIGALPHPHPPPAHVTLPPAPLPHPHPKPYPAAIHLQRPGVIYSKKIILVPPGGLPPHRALDGRPPPLGPELEYPDYATRFPLYPELPAPSPATYGYAFGAIPQAGPPQMFVDAAGRVWTFPAGGPPPPVTYGYDGFGFAPETAAPANERPLPGGGELTARSEPTTVDRLKADIAAELKRIAAIQRSLNVSDEGKPTPESGEDEAKGFDKRGAYTGGKNRRKRR